MSLQYIIDGCNIIHNPLFSRTSNEAPNDKRPALLELINSKKLTGSLRNKVIVVFDGFPSHDCALRLDQVRKEISVIFSGKVTADETIRRIVEGSEDAKGSVIVSDDKEIKFLARLFQAQWQSVEKFLRLKKESHRKASHRQDACESGISYTEMQRINQELRQIWLKP